MRDAIDDLNENLRRLIELLDDDTPGAGSRGLRTLGPNSLVIRETADQDEANPDGTLTLSPGDEKALVQHEPATDAGAVLAVGASDEQNVRYGLRIDSTYFLGGRTESPLGSINDPFTFPNRLGAMVAVTKRAEYVAAYDGDASGDIDLAARLFMEER